MGKTEEELKEVKRQNAIHLANIQTYKENERILVENERSYKAKIKELRDTLQNQQKRIDEMQIALNELSNKNASLSTELSAQSSLLLQSNPPSSSSEPSVTLPPEHMDVVDHQDESQSKATKDKKKKTKVYDPSTVKPPPIFVNGIKDISIFNKFMTSNKLESCMQKTTNTNQLVLKPTSIDNYRSLVKLLTNEQQKNCSPEVFDQLQFHTYEPKCDKSFVVFIRHLHPTTLVEDIATELKNVGHIARRITNVKIRKKEGDKVNFISIPLFRVELEPKDNNKEVLDLSALLYTKVKVEPPRKRAEVPQCKKCQGIGHSQNYCHRSPRCVKCGGNHKSQDCTKPKETKRHCVNCMGEHTANYRGCPKFQEKIASQRQPKISIVERMKMATKVDPNSTFADKLRKKSNPVEASGVRNTVSLATEGANSNNNNTVLSTGVQKEVPRDKKARLQPGEKLNATTPPEDIATLIRNLQTSLNQLCFRIDKIEESVSPRKRKVRRND